MKWNYADMSKNAKDHGGPEKYIADIHAAGFTDALRSMKVPVAVGSTLAGVLVGGAAAAAYSARKERRETIDAADREADVNNRRD